MADLDYIEKHALLHVVMTGNPVDGFSLIGTFNNWAEAHEYAVNTKFEYDWWLVPVHKPD